MEGGGCEENCRQGEIGVAECMRYAAAGLSIRQVLTVGQLEERASWSSLCFYIWRGAAGDLVNTAISE